MEEKKKIKISLSTILLFLAIIAIIVMGYFTYKLNNDKRLETNKVSNLQLQINQLNNTISSLQRNMNNDTQDLSNNNQDLQKDENDKGKTESEDSSDTAIIKIYDDQPYVFTKEQTTRGELQTPLFELPFINVQGKGIEVINNKLNNIYEYLKSAITYSEMNGLSYRYDIDADKNIIKLVLLEGTGAGESRLLHTRFYIDMTSGKELTNEDLLNKYGINESNIMQKFDEMIEKYYNYILENKNTIVYNMFDWENVSFDEFYSNWQVFNKNTNEIESFQFDNINYYEVDLDVKNGSFTINDMLYKGRPIGIDGYVMSSW